MSRNRSPAAPRAAARPGAGGGRARRGARATPVAGARRTAPPGARMPAPLGTSLLMPWGALLSAAPPLGVTRGWEQSPTRPWGWGWGPPSHRCPMASPRASGASLGRSGLDPGEGAARRHRGFRMERQEFKACCATSRVLRGQQAPQPPCASVSYSSHEIAGRVK